MTEATVRAMFRKLKARGADTLRIEHDERTRKVTHAEIYQDSWLIWKWPMGSRTRMKKRDWTHYGIEWKAFNLTQRADGYELEQMARYTEV